MNDQNIRQVRKDLAEKYRYLEVAEAKLRQGNVPSSEVDEMSRVAQEAEELQGQVDKYEEIAGVAKKGRELQKKTMPRPDMDTNHRGVKTTPGELFVTSEAFRAYTATGKQGWSAKVDVKGLRGEDIVLKGDEADKYLSRIETKQFDGTLPSLAADTFPPRFRDPDEVRVQEMQILTVRDVLNTLPVTTDSVRYVRYTPTYAAQSQDGRGTEKVYGSFAATTATVNIETIAVLHKVSEQDIEDSPRLIQIINGEMRHDVKVEEERQLVWGGGTDGELDGIFPEIAAYEFDRAGGQDTVIDTIRRMRTDIRKRQGVANAVMIDPIDWEEAELAKGSTTGNDHYIWGLVSDLRGPRIWSLRVIESDAMTSPDDGSRRVLVGDFLRGATLYDRHDVRLAVGFVDDDFARNLRTLRAEERVALAVKRPWLFSWAETAVAES